MATVEEEKELYDRLPDQDIEEEEVTEILDDPFNPNEISIASKIVPMESCIRRIEQGTIKLNPDFQRNEVWTLEKKSQLIESLMLRIPLPMFYVSADEKNNFTVVDGLQRLSTIRSFVIGDDYLAKKGGAKKGEGFTLERLEFWKDFEGKTFNELPTHIQNNILEAQFTFTIINPGTPEEVRRNIFKRLNTGGMPLSSQEIRNALYIGQSTILLNELVSYQEFKDAAPMSYQKENRMEDKELVLRFLSFLIRPYKTYKKISSVDTHLSDTMIIINAFPDLKTKDFKKLVNKAKDRIKEEDIINRDINLIKEIFKVAMNRGEKLFGRHAFRKSYGSNRRSPINKSLFETWGVLLSALSPREFDKLYANKDQFLNDYIQIIDNYSFKLAISKDSMSTTSVKYRFETVQRLINTHIDDTKNRVAWL